MKLRQAITDYLTFTKRERNGVFLLVAIVIVLIIVINLVDVWVPEEQFDHTAFQQEIAAFEASVSKAEEEQELRYSNKFFSNEPTTELEPEYFAFDPNQLPVDQWRKLGLRDWQIKMIHKYESKGGSFRKKADLLRMYCIDEELYAKLEPYVDIPEQPNPEWETFEKSPNKKEVLLVDLNTADTIELKKLKGIGSGFARRIVKYRNMLGGFHSAEQLKEVYYMKPETVEGIKPNLQVDASVIQKISINTATAAELKSHPYIDWNRANAIVNYREKHGEYQSVESIKNTDLINEELLTKLAPYLTL